MKKEENSENEFLQELSPLLFDKRIAVDAEPPAGYFDGLTDQITDKIIAEDGRNSRGRTKIIQFVNFRNLAVAAGIAVIIALIPFFNSNNIDQTLRSELVINTDTEISELNEYIDESDLYSAFEENEFSKTAVSEDLNEEEIIDYLIREDYNEELLIEMR
ncbi:hypothetical protein G3O08_15185 [Cryomorpha ignava]|uniref:Uncharacterized protein n=1 Tax=Cryomorpha ignava TaxID=101383 RepID=A0A7K3WW63_9FLAO|nr:hypothetical protein [Cryomorpha ignava]NEN24845.1 hypothetical protein [Cryomorpha ignava]